MVWRYGVLGLFSGLLVSVPDVAPALSAVRLCGPVVSSQIITQKSDFDARKQAMDQWHAKALKLGVAYNSWRIAAWKSLQCAERKGGRHQCVAFGAPCTIVQNPNNAKVRPQRGKA